MNQQFSHKYQQKSKTVKFLILVCTLFLWKPASQSLTSVGLADQHYDSGGAEAKTAVHRPDST